MLNPAVSQKKLLWKPKKPLFFWWIWGVSPVIGISAYQILTEFNVFIPKIEVVFDHWQILERGKKMESSPFCWMFVWSIFGDFWGARTLELQSKQSRHHNFLPVCCQVLKSLIQPTSSQNLILTLCMNNVVDDDVIPEMIWFFGDVWGPIWHQDISGWWFQILCSTTN